ncbi:hypothetical protein QFZ77_003308 [Paenibacillus sp. V4I3]|uniref:right-handed parallel beta-helix repeat-containing protein n=1 Tax=Paenibacillus sp. V4I3 TaxID=3042305 RepID=UPI002785E902|nr:right-handed parallel beta-helix repeat-containing protein [Paenibacillus sp. V4I3]MDQ0874649.1 hypothetical protein [Paenibacillus sp. V4I3]
MTSTLVQNFRLKKKAVTRMVGLVSLICLIICSLFVGLAPIQTAHAAVQDTFYVSTIGNDITGDGSSGNPWATIEKARDYIRTNSLNTNMTGDIVVNVAAGDYYVSSTIQFTDADSGSNGFNIIYKNKDAVGSAQFIGGQPITGWSQHSGNIYKAYVGTGWRFDTLYENGTRAIKARYPNYTPDANYITAKAPYLYSENSNSFTVLQYKAGDLDPTGWDLTDAQLFVWSLGPAAWFTDAVPISSINTSTRQISLSQSTRYLNRANSRYVIQGALALLDQPGEFHLDTTSGYLYYWSKDGSITQQTIIAPKVKSIISLQGASESSRVHHVQLDGLSFQDTDFTDWYRHAWPHDGDSGEGHTFPQYDRQMTMPQHRTGMLLLQNTDHIAITNSHFSNSGYSAVYMLFYNQNNTVSGNLIEHAGHSGVILEGKYPGEGDVSKNNLITNNVIHDVGELVGNGSGVYLMNSGSNEVSYSEIYNSPRYAVAFDTYLGIATTNIYLKNNVMKYLKISNTNQDSGDTASIYSWGRSAAANTVNQVTIDHVYAHPSMQDIAPNGIFMDNETSGQVFSNIKISNTQGAPYRLNSSSGHTLTNVSWQAGFNDSLMDYANIGIKADFPYPVTPVGLTTSFSGSQVNLSWQNVINAANYDVWRSTVQGGPYTTAVCSAVTSTTCSDTTGTPGTTYYYVVKSRTSASLISGNSNEAAQLYNDLIFDGFESGLTNWNTNKGTASISTAQAHAGSYSYVINEDTDVISHSFSTTNNKIVSLWAYDDASDTSMQTMAKVDNTIWSDGTGWRGLGVNTPTSTTKYVTRVGGTYTATSVTRSTGWHELKWDYTSGTKVDMYVDGVLVSSPTGVTNFNQISMGDWWSSNTGTVYFDDISITNPFVEGFESGFGNWSSAKGTGSASTTQAHSGSNSYVINQDEDVISHTFSTSDNKVISLWFNDAAADMSMQTMAKVDNTIWSDGTQWRGLGVNTPTSTTKYVTRVGSTYTATSVTRTTRWHELKWDYTSGTKVDMFVDGVLVSSPTGVTNFNQISMGDWWTGNTGTVYFDDVNVQ